MSEVEETLNDITWEFLGKSASRRIEQGSNELWDFVLKHLGEHPEKRHKFFGLQFVLDVENKRESANPERQSRPRS